MDVVTYCKVCNKELHREHVILSALGHDYSDWLQGGKIAQIGETVTLGGVDFTLDEVGNQ